jgi:two-component system NarL family response regulator
MSDPVIRLLVADDHAVVRLGLRKLIEAQPDMGVVAEASSGPEAVLAFERARPDVTLMDLRMPGGDGTEAIAALIARAPEARVLVLTTYDGDEEVFRAVAAGARGYLRKDIFPAGMLEAIRLVHAGERLFDAGVQGKLDARDPADALTGREEEVLHLVARGLGNREIQLALSIAEGTLKNHLKHIFAKLRVSDRTSAALAAVQRGIIRL